MSSENFVAPKKKLPLVKLAIVAFLAIVVAVLVLRGLDLRALTDQLMTMVRNTGPTVFFAAMAVLPAVGFPIMPFDLAAGPVFGERLGMPLVVTLALAAITVNFVVSYWLARRALRPLLEKLLNRLGYPVPKMEDSDLTDLTILIRVTPGPPFFVQNYLLGLAGVPFGRYMLISCIVTWVYTAGLVLFGDALLHGKGKMAVLAASLLVVAAVITHWARKHYGKKGKKVEKVEVKG
jgi:uncharacterized membrane protein YdjX (TVP38/TMEM64 family)